MAFTEHGFKSHAVRVPGNTRTWKFGGGNGNTTGLLVTAPIGLLAEVFGPSFDGGRATLQYSTDNVTFNALAANVAFTSSGLQLIAPPDTKTGYYRFAVTNAAGTALDLVAILVAVGSTDIL